MSDIINQYSKNKFTIPVDTDKVYLVSPLKNCVFCDGNLVVIQSRKGGKKAILYTSTGGVHAVVYVKHCTKCNAYAYPAYSDSMNEATVQRKYVKSDKMMHFSITSETYFDIPFLNMLTEDLFTCFTRFSSFVEKYNRLYEAFPLIKKRVIDAYLIYAINSRLNGIEFPVVRDSFRNLSIEETCKVLYPQLRRFIDLKWISHMCSLCKTRIVVLDGAAKIYRNVCAAKPQKETALGELNQFNCCINSPLPGKIYCSTHVNNKSGDTTERLDHGVLTRAKRKELGLDADCLSSTVGCRKPDKITTR